MGACMTRAIAFAPVALVLHLLAATTPTETDVIFSGHRCGTEGETSGQRQ